MNGGREQHNWIKHGFVCWIEREVSFSMVNRLQLDAINGP